DPDAYLLALAVDALPPVVLRLGPFGWSPTVELTWHMRAVPAAGPLRIATRGRHGSGRWVDEGAEGWGPAGRPGAQGRRIARARPAARNLVDRASDDHRLLGVVPRPGQPLLLLPAGGGGVPAAARPGQRVGRRAAAARGPVRHRCGLPEPPARRPLPRPVRLLR